MRATLEKVMAERAARRKAEYEALILITPFYTDAEGFIVFNKAETNPTFVGGDEAMDKFLKENVVYPTEAKDKGVEGTVFVDFIVAASGKVRAVAVTDAPGEEVDQSLRDEAIRVVTSMPTWVPGRQRGKAVDVKYSVPVSFVMN
jgi:TonB family protein